MGVARKSHPPNPVRLQGWCDAKRPAQKILQGGPPDLPKCAARLPLVKTRVILVPLNREAERNEHKQRESRARQTANNQ